MNKLKIILPVLLGIVVIGVVAMKDNGISESGRLKFLEQINQLALDKNNFPSRPGGPKATSRGCQPPEKKEKQSSPEGMKE